MRGDNDMDTNTIYTRYAAVPDELKKAKNWVCTGTDKIPKCPYTGGNAQSNNPSTWGTFDEAVEACVKYGFTHIGFMFAPPFFGVDLDHCIDKVDFCDEFVETLQSYNEISCSGEGLHIICKGELPDGARRKGGVEMYSGGRYFKMTGNVYNTAYSTLRDCTESIKPLHAKHLATTAPKTAATTQSLKSTITMDDDDVIDKARACKSGSLFQTLYEGNWQGLYPSQSEADMAFCNHLAFWTAKNREQMDRIFRNSGLMRDKWDQMRGAATYGNITIGKACASCEQVYDPATYDDDATLAVTFFSNGGMSAGGNGSSNSAARYDMTDTGNAHRLCDKYGDVIRYSFNRKKWYVWTGKQWMLDEMGEVKKLADDICEEMKVEAMAEGNPKEMEKKLKFALKTASSGGKEAMLKECQHLGDVPAAPDDFDAYGDYLNCQNGVVNLRNGELMPHDPGLMITKMCNAEYDPNCGTPKRWTQFIDEITGGNKDLARYLQKCIGYSACGSGSEQCAFFLYGMGNNGKSTLLDTIADIFGSYASNAQPDTLMLQSRVGSSGGGANSDIARLKNVRFVTCEEPTEGVRLNEGLLKQLTGGSKVTCRFLYGDEFEYTPEFKIWIATNHKPTIRGTDFGIWRRIKLIPFEVNIPKDKVDKNLKYKLREEFPQILAWIVEGYRLWTSEGIDEPDCVKHATDEYKNEMDIIAGFVEQCITIDYEDGNRLMASDIFPVYVKWAKQNNEFEMSSKRFFMELQKKLPDKGRNGKGIYYSKCRFSEGAAQFLPQKTYSAADFK